ncbi:hypothetical protein [Streptomyces sp. CB00455]|uniref:hypothetical protein n=1 Tax=Streptomyces sp. CB00455 TaxID=1703927 RepID=UPI00093F167F|nr:hypothetical protein [Streptomyces sp. CB00455]
MIGTFFSLALLFDGPSLIALGTEARRIPGLVREDEAVPEAGGPGGVPVAARHRPGEDQEQSNN